MELNFTVQLTRSDHDIWFVTACADGEYTATELCDFAAATQDEAINTMGHFIRSYVRDRDAVEELDERTWSCQRPAGTGTPLEAAS